MEAMATMNSTDTGRSVTWSGVVMSVKGTRTSPATGMTANAVMAGMATTNGASMNTSLSAAVGVKSSLNISFMPSARDCSNPNGPFMFGPWRCCMKATTRRSNQMVNRVSTSSTTRANTALIATTHQGSRRNSSLIARPPVCQWGRGGGSRGSSPLLISSRDLLVGHRYHVSHRPDRHQVTGPRGQVLRHLDAGRPAAQPHHTVDHGRVHHRRQDNGATVVGHLHLCPHPGRGRGVR